MFNKIKIFLLIMVLSFFGKNVAANYDKLAYDFNFKDLISPYEVFESPDSRKLGILIKSIKISPI